MNTEEKVYFFWKEFLKKVKDLPKVYVVETNCTLEQRDDCCSKIVFKIETNIMD